METPGKDAPPNQSAQPGQDAQPIASEMNTQGVSFDDVYREEWTEIRERREKQLYLETVLPDQQNKIPPENIVGLALSGGGIRSATFCLGFLQGMHKLRLLRIFDYLSTVSGGGYVGGWWSAWLARDQLSSQIGDDFALLCAADIKDPASLAIKLRGSGDDVSVNLRERFSPDTLKLLASYKERNIASEKLVDALVKELNLAIAGKYLSTLSEGEAGSQNGHNQKSITNEELRFEKHSPWANRMLLESAYPLEIKDLFPPREKIEPERQEMADPTAPPVDGVSGGRQEAESSKNAWKDPIHHLRLYANYLTPRRGLLSADTWRAVSVITRNLALTWLILLPVLTSLILIGQMYFLIHPSTSKAFLGNQQPVMVAVADYLQSPPAADVSGARDIFRNRLIVIGQLVGAFVGWVVVMALAWLLLSRDDSSVSYWVIQVVCLGAVMTLILTAVNIIKPLDEIWALIARWYVGLALWGAVAGLLLFSVFLRQPTTKNAPYADRETNIRWKREVWRNHISRIHTRLMVTAFVALVVLLLAGFGHEIITYLRTFGGFKLNALSLVPVISAIAGAIFTAMRATPTGGGEKPGSREPSAISRFIFAVTPGLVLIVLAVFISWLGHWLLAKLLQTDRVGLMQTVAVFYGISLCLALAVYEMKWRTFRLSWSMIAFVCLLTANISWGMRALWSYILSSHQMLTMLLLLSVSLFVAAGIAFIAVHRAFVKNQWHKSLREKYRRLWRDRSRHPVLRLASVALSLLALASVAPWVIAAWTGGRGLPINLQLELAAFAGSFILFRLLLTRSREEPDSFELKVLKSKASSRSPESMWLAAACCLLLPIAVSSWLHVIFAHILRNHWDNKNLILIFLPFAIGALFGSLILFRIAANTLRAEIKSETIIVEPNALERLLLKVCTDSPKLHPLKVMAIGGIGFIIIAGLATRKATGSVPIAQQWSVLPINLSSIIFALVVSVILFAVSGPQTAPAGVTPYPFKWFVGKLGPDQHQRQKFLWMLAGGCILLGLLVGFLADIGFEHVGEYPFEPGYSLKSVVLPGMAACFTLALFEMRWGEVGNRRSLWLLASAYLILTVLFVIGFILDNSTTFEQGTILFVRQLLTVLGVLVAMLVWVVALGWMVDPNSVSMHQFYKARLVRAYLGASNIKRRKQRKEITESTIDDDLLLTSLKNCRRGAPYHLINTTLNLVAGRDLATAQRSASSFVLSERYCGSSRTSYRPTSEYMEGQLSLGTAVAASGAAVSPSMGAKKPTAALAMLLTLMNVRLGFWAPTPNRENWKLSQPRLWPFYLLREFLSQTNDLSSYCYLTDGGHFDNTGLYSLVERGCRYIVLVDCGADPEPCFQDLGDAIRRCRIDFGTEISLNIEPFIMPGEKSAPCVMEKKSPAGFVAGKIRYSRKHAELLHWELNHLPYSREDKNSRTGSIIYFKPSLINNATADVKQYGIENGLFPQQSTAHQWFDEAQFESYRRLGQSYAKEAFENLRAVSLIANKRRISVEEVEAIFIEAKHKFDPADKLSNEADEINDSSR
jgi:hypothetical protein